MNQKTNALTAKLRLMRREDAAAQTVCWYVWGIRPARTDAELLYRRMRAMHLSMLIDYLERYKPPVPRMIWLKKMERVQNVAL